MTDLTMTALNTRIVLAVFIDTIRVHLITKPKRARSYATYCKTN